MSPDKADSLQTTKSDPTTTTLRLIKKSRCVEGHLGRHKRRAKLRSLREKQVLQVKDSDASLRLATDLPRFNWLELKLNQYDPKNIAIASPVSKIIKRDAKHKFLAQLSAQNKDSDCDLQAMKQQIQQPQPNTTESKLDVCALTSCNASLAVGKRTAVNEESKDIETLNRWPLKKRIMKNEGISSSCVKDSTAKDVEKYEEITLVEEIKSQTSTPSPKPAETCIEIKSTKGNPEEQPLDLSRLTKPSVEQPAVTVVPRLKVIPEAKIHLIQPKEIPELKLLPSNTNYGDRLRPAVPLSVMKVPVIQHRQTIQPPPVVSIHQYSVGNKLLSHPRVIENWGFTCNVCGKKAGFRCAECKKSAYCSVFCQAMDWSRHSIPCRLTKKVLLTH